MSRRYLLVSPCRDEAYYLAITIESVAAISWIGVVSVAAILAVGMSWSQLRRTRQP